MFKRTLRYLMSTCTAAFMALTLGACGGDAPEPEKEKEAPKTTEPDKATEAPKTTEPDKATETPKTTEPDKATERAKDGSFKCAKCGKVKSLAIFHHDPDHEDRFMERIEVEARKLWDGAFVARENMRINLS